MSITKISAAALVFAGLTTAAFAESDDNQASTNILNALAGTRVAAPEAYASVPAQPRRVSTPAYTTGMQFEDYPNNQPLPTH